MKSKGFTLVELLAVIVILAILVLVATPAVTNMITKSSKNAFKSEILGIVKDFDKAYTEKVGLGVKNATSGSDLVGTSIYNVSINGKKYKYLCMTLKDLVDEQYTKKSLGNDYGGYIQTWVPDGAGDSLVFVNTTNTKFYLQGMTSRISDSEFVPTQSESKIVVVPNKDTSCPKELSIPYSAHNIQDGETTDETIR